MPTPALTEDQAREAVARVEAKLREGFRPPGMTGRNSVGAIMAAAEQAVADGLVITTGSFETRFRRGLEKFPHITLDESHYRPLRYQQPVAQLQFLPATPLRISEPGGRLQRGLIIPDRHNDPRHPHRLDCTLWIARYGSEHRHDFVEDLGDAVTMDSCSRFDKNDTLRGRMKPPIRDDLDNHEQTLIAFERGRAPDWKPRKWRRRGNHESRLFAFENQHPENEGTHTHRYCQDLLRFGWRETEFGEIGYVENVGFVHAPFNGMGKAMGGKTATHRAGNLLCRSLIHGHTHSFEVHNAAKLDPTDRVTVVQAGCALPEGEVEHYALHTPTGWSHGVLDITVQDGEILDLAFVSMRTLRNRYSDDGADVRAA